MKNNYILIALAMVAALTIVSCKNNKKEKVPTQEEVQEMKQALADSVLTLIDAFAEKFITASDNSFRISGFELTETQKLQKPDYLLDPAEANNLVTKTQKINALAIYIIELSIRHIYDMPLEEAKEAIAKLAMEVNYPFGDFKYKYEDKLPISELIKAEYEKCKENGSLSDFLKNHRAIVIETSYLFAQNPELFFSKITEEQWQNYCLTKAYMKGAIEELAKYDEEIATISEYSKKYRVTKSDEERKVKDSSIESAKQFMIANKDNYIALRNTLLQ